MTHRKPLDEMRADRRRSRDTQTDPKFVTGEILPPGTSDGYKSRAPAPYKPPTPEMRYKFLTGRPDLEDFERQTQRAIRIGQALVELKKTQNELIKVDGEGETEWQTTETAYGCRQFVPLEVKRIGEKIHHRLTLQREDHENELTERRRQRAVNQRLDRQDELQLELDEARLDADIASEKARAKHEPMIIAAEAAARKEAARLQQSAARTARVENELDELMVREGIDPAYREMRKHGLRAQHIDRNAERDKEDVRARHYGDPNGAQDEIEDIEQWAHDAKKEATRRAANPFDSHPKGNGRPS